MQNPELTTKFDTGRSPPREINATMGDVFTTLDLVIFFTAIWTLAMFSRAIAVFMHYYFY